MKHNFKAEVIAYNTELRNALQLIFNELNNGQQKKLLKNETIRTLLERYGVVSETEVK